MGIFLEFALFHYCAMRFIGNFPVIFFAPFSDWRDSVLSKLQRITHWIPEEPFKDTSFPRKIKNAIEFPTFPLVCEQLPAKLKRRSSPNDCIWLIPIESSLLKATAKQGKFNFITGIKNIILHFLFDPK